MQGYLEACFGSSVGSLGVRAAGVGVGSSWGEAGGARSLYCHMLASRTSPTSNSSKRVSLFWGLGLQLLHCFQLQATNVQDSVRGA